MKSLFIVSSAIMAGNGNPQERFLQTLHTIDSIKYRIPEADIWLCESSVKPLDDYMVELLSSVRILDFSGDHRVHEIKKQVNEFKSPFSSKDKKLRLLFESAAIKNLTESYIVNQVLSKVDLAKYDRIFKISGRYFLTDNFNLKEHQHAGKITLKYQGESKLAKFTNSKYYRHCVLWNFCTSIFKDIRKSFINIEEYLINQYESGLLGDIEHGLDLFVPHHLIHEIKSTGVVGRVNNDQIHFN